jgi:hypothetical protein
MITRWLNQDTGSASGVPPTVPILIVDVQFTGDLASEGWQTVVYVKAASGIRETEKR